jgi:hypothetical protein
LESAKKNADAEITILYQINSDGLPISASSVEKVFTLMPVGNKNLLSIGREFYIIS